MKTENSQLNSQVRYVFSIIDTEAIMAKYSKPSTNPHKPIVLTEDISMFSSNLNVVYGQGTKDLIIKAALGDHISFVAESGYANDSSTVLIYKVRHVAMKKVLNPHGRNTQKKEYMLPLQDTCYKISNVDAERFCFFDAGVVDMGAEVYAIGFAIYQQTENKDSKLYGYFERMAQIKVLD